MTTATISPIHPEIPLDRAWRDGKRIYVRATYKSMLDAEIRQIGGHWDAQARALYVPINMILVVTEIVQRLLTLAAAQTNGTTPKRPASRRRSCITDGNCSSFGDGRSCGAHDCDGY